MHAPPGPREPLLIGGLHWIAWIFILLALGDLVFFIVTASFSPTPSIADFVVYALTVLPAVVAILFPAALLARHPDATTRAPVFLLGTILFALVQWLFILANPLQPIFGALTPPSDDLPGFVASAEIYNGLTLVLAAVGLVLIARGLSLARRYEDEAKGPIELLVPVAAVLATVVGIVAVSKQTIPDPVPAAFVVFVAANVATAILRVAAWAYLARNAVRGWLGGEDPSVGWLLAALAAAVSIFAIVLVSLPGVLDVQDPTIVQVYGAIIVVVYALGHLGLLAAFALGLPSLDSAEEDDEPGYRGEPVYVNEFPEERRR